MITAHLCCNPDRTDINVLCNNCIELGYARRKVPVVQTPDSFCGMAHFEITRTDLIDFHTSHFGFSPDIVPLSDGVCADSEAVPEKETVEYYSDGTIRTLTEDQIAFFRASEIRKLQKSKETHFEVYKASSNEETLPGTPISNDRSRYEKLFGKFSGYIKQLEDSNDSAYIDTCRIAQVKAYYPAAPLR